MSIEYLGLSEINGPLVVLEGVQDAFFEEVVEFVVSKTGSSLRSAIGIPRSIRSLHFS